MSPAEDPTPAVLVAGDALVDMSPITGLGRIAYEPHPGGSCLNIAVGLGRLGVPAALLARVSSDAFGSLLRTHLRESQVSERYLIDTDDPTTLALVHLTEGQATYSFYAQGTADTGLSPEHLSALPPGAALHLGSIALVLEPVSSTLEQLMLREARNRLVTLDPNIRPGLIPDRAAYLRRFNVWLRAVDVVKVSEEDLLWLEPDQTEDEVVAAWLAAGVALVLVTHGDRGSRASTTRSTVQVPTPRVDVVDTIGAGDAFMAGAHAHLHQHGLLDRDAIAALGEESLAELLHAASLVAAETCTRPGADPPRRVASYQPDHETDEPTQSC